MIAEARTAIDGTYRPVWPGSTYAAPLDPQRRALLTVWLRPRSGGELDAARAAELGGELPHLRTYADPAALAAETSFDPDDLAALQRYCGKFELEIRETHWRSAVVAGSVANLLAAFGATAATFVDSQGRHFRHRMGSLHVPADLSSILRGAFGLHQWPRSRKLRTLERHSTPLRAEEVAARYAFAPGSGSGQTIAVVQLRGQFNEADFTRCMTEQNIVPPQVVVRRVDDTDVTHELATAKDLEAALDTQIIGALAPNARIVIYEAPDDERGFLDAVRAALFDPEYRANVISISYGWPEPLWTPAVLDLLNDLFTFAALSGVSIFCSSGDSGAELAYDGRPHVVAPASCPFAHACGATVLASDGSGTETAWERSGGGFSEHFAAMPWQTAAPSVARQYGVRAGRGVPDVCAQQQPGYFVYLEGVELAMGGTSAIAPLWAALAARINERSKAPLGFFAPLLYRNPAAFRAIAAGANDFFRAAPGWNPCTGLGVPVGTAVAAAIRGDDG